MGHARRRAGPSDRLEGVRPVIEALRAGRRRVLDVALPAARASAGLRELEALARQRGVRIDPDPAPEVRARVEPFPEEPAEALLADPELEWLVALDGVTDVGNLGSIARSAEGAGAQGLVLEQRHAPPIGPGACRASAGALEWLRVGRTPSLKRSLELARQEGFALLVAEPGGGSLAAVDLEHVTGRLIWVLGGEEKGTRPVIRQLADAVVGVPQRGRIASLGVAATAAHLLLRTAEIRSEQRSG